MVLAARRSRAEAPVLVVLPAALYKRLVVVLAALMVVAVVVVERVTTMTPLPALLAQVVVAEYG
jgi:hypothetical protein